MRIEDNYKDVIIYSVEFRTIGNRKINKIIILNIQENDFSDDKIKNIVMKTFANVLEVIRVEEFMDGLLLFEDSQYYI